MQQAYLRLPHEVHPARSGPARTSNHVRFVSLAALWPPALKRILLGRLRGDAGQDTTEYALLMALVALASVVMLGVMSTGLDQTWQRLADRLVALTSLF